MKSKSVRPVFRRLAALSLVVASCGLASGCAAFSAPPWDRDLMAKRAMQLNPHPNITAAYEHVYFSKEGSSGGRTFDGGGCGCN